ncbi:DUF92 domain-containing protein [Thermococcus gammatolerans]|uniref:Integral membrane protein n=1 Tax=Thermococcus gammatolerans (strain DSM 15229 / JCM 11827 / EJ3) TaxID=593117 RepID=C5A406_THEGJ|nr:DUF92 domain-containing protein [Thermococcus gammatolerans]ACS32968.1 Integral membrane protein [Thermococcus gammatolerans EJ3]
MHDPSFTTLIIGLIVPLLGVIAYRAKALDLAGTLASVLLGILVIYLGGVYTFLALLVFLVFGTATTKYRFNEKVKKGFSSIEERTRSVGNVLGNGLAVVVFLIVEAITRQDVFWAATFSAIATVNGDTLASELGKVYGKRPRLITNLKPVKPGTNGGISLAGELFALLGVLVIVPFALPLTKYDLTMTLAVLTGGFLGINADSFIGATLENKGLLDNNGTNFLASLIGGLIGALVFYTLGG